MRSRRPGIAPLAALAFAVAFVIWTSLTFGGALAGIDALVAPPVAREDPVVQVAMAMAVLFMPLVVYLAAGSTALWALRRRLRNLAIGIGFAILLGWFGHWALRELYRRPRPPGLLPELISNQGYGFPSGHLVAITTAAIVVIATTTTTRQSRRVIEVWRWSGIALVLLIAVDRWLLHAHWPTDIVAGILFGGFTVSTAFSLARVHMQPEAPARPVRTDRRCAVIVNPTKVPDWAAFRRHVEFECAENGWTPLWLETTEDDPGRGMARRAIRRKVDMVLAAGGDGTIRVVCSELAGTGIPLGLIPSGTGNLLARNLGVPLDESEALDVAFAGRRRNIDLVGVRVDDAEPDHFAVMAGMGLDARIMGSTNSELKKMIGPAAYVLAAREAANSPMFEARISLDDETLERTAGIVLVGNVGGLQANVQLLPDAAFDDGLLDLFVASPKDAADWVRVSTSALLPVPDAPEIDRGQGRRVVIEVDAPVEYQLDGDAAGRCRRIEATLLPHALVVMVPGA